MSAIGVLALPATGLAGADSAVTRAAGVPAASEAGATTMTPPLTAAPRHWYLVLRRLSDARAAAWRQGEPRLLRSVYEPSTRPLLRDQAMLRQYVDRGLRVRGVRLAFRAVQVVHLDPRTAVLAVTDQLGRAVAVTGAGRRIELPRDRPSRQTLVLHRNRHQWRVAEVMRR
jgi:hypothetical protein